MNSTTEVVTLSLALEMAGLVWKPEIGDEVLDRYSNRIMILTDNFGLPPSELRKIFLWLPRMEQLIEQIEARQAVILRLGWIQEEVSIGYDVEIGYQGNVIQAKGLDARLALGTGLFKLLQFIKPSTFFH